MSDINSSLPPYRSLTFNGVTRKIADVDARQVIVNNNNNLLSEIGSYSKYELSSDQDSGIGKYVLTGGEFVLLTEDNISDYPSFGYPRYERVGSPSGIKGIIEAHISSNNQSFKNIDRRIDEVSNQVTNAYNELDQKIRETGGDADSLIKETNARIDSTNSELERVEEKFDNIHKSQHVMATDGLPEVDRTDENSVNAVLGNTYLVPASLSIAKGGKGVNVADTYIEWIWSTSKNNWEEIGNTEAYLYHDNSALQGKVVSLPADADSEQNYKISLSPLDVYRPKVASNWYQVESD